MKNYLNKLEIISQKYFHSKHLNSTIVETSCLGYEQNHIKIINEFKTMPTILNKTCFVNLIIIKLSFWKTTSSHSFVIVLVRS